MNVLRILRSGQMLRQARMRLSVSSLAAGRFIALSTRVDACWNGTSRYGSTLRSAIRSEEHTSELQSIMRNSYAVFFLKIKNKSYDITHTTRRTTNVCQC